MHPAAPSASARVRAFVRAVAQGARTTVRSGPEQSYLSIHPSSPVAMSAAPAGPGAQKQAAAVETIVVDTWEAPDESAAQSPAVLQEALLQTHLLFHLKERLVAPDGARAGTPLRAAAAPLRAAAPMRAAGSLRPLRLRAADAAPSNHGLLVPRAAGHRGGRRTAPGSAANATHLDRRGLSPSLAPAPRRGRAATASIAGRRPAHSSNVHRDRRAQWDVSQWDVSTPVPKIYFPRFLKGVTFPVETVIQTF